jgi:uncharacterized phage protein (TIGR01671 family)
MIQRGVVFRGKRLDNNEWSYGDLIQLHDGRMYIVDNRFGAAIDHEGNFINTEAPYVNKVDPITVGQSTDLPDRNGKTIYEDDYIKYNEWLSPLVHKVFWSMGGFNAAPARMSFSSSAEDWQNVGRTDCDILGNVHDNPELEINDVKS